MSVVVRFESGDGQGLLVEVEDHAYGVQQIARRDNGLIEAGQRLDEVLATARPTIRAVVDAIRELAPDEHQIEFGLKINAEAGRHGGQDLDGRPFHREAHLEPAHDPASRHPAERDDAGCEATG